MVIFTFLYLTNERKLEGPKMSFKNINYIKKPCDNKYRNFYIRNFDLLAKALLQKHRMSQFLATNGDV